MKKILYVDMDGVLVDFQSGIDRLDEQTKSQHKENMDEVPGIFSLMHPIDGAIESFELLANHFFRILFSVSPGLPLAMCGSE